MATIVSSNQKMIVDRMPCTEKRRPIQISRQRTSQKQSQRPHQHPYKRPSRWNQYHPNINTKPSMTVPPTILSCERGDINVFTILSCFLILLWQTLSVLRTAYWIPFDAISQSPALIYEFRNRGCKIAGPEGEQQEAWGQFVEI